MRREAVSFSLVASQTCWEQESGKEQEAWSRHREQLACGLFARQSLGYWRNSTGSPVAIEKGRVQRGREKAGEMEVCALPFGLGVCFHLQEEQPKTLI